MVLHEFPVGYLRRGKMGMMINGTWSQKEMQSYVRDSENIRFSSGFHHVVEEEKLAPFPAEPGRYSLYFNRTCPWSHRAVVTAKLKGLSQVVEEIEMEPAMGSESWWFGDNGEYQDPAIGATHLHELYAKSDKKFTGRVSIPVLWDKREERIVNNSSGSIARMFNCEFNKFAEYPAVDFYPKNRAEEIDALNEEIGDRVTDGVYRCLLAESQTTYDNNFIKLFSMLDNLNERLKHTRYLLGDSPTEPDWRLFGSLIRFDAVYYNLYKCNEKRIVDYDELWGYTRDLYQIPGVSETVDLEKIKVGYYHSVKRNSIIPKGPFIDFDAPHNRCGSKTEKY